MRLLTCVLFGLLLVAPAQAAGQPGEQTPDGAMRFLGRWMQGIDIRQDGVGSATVSSVQQREPCRLDGIATTRDGQTAPFFLRFAHISSVAHQAGNSIVSVYGERGTLYLDFRAPDMAARAAYALEFMRRHCDPTSDTGF